MALKTSKKISIMTKLADGDLKKVKELAAVKNSAGEVTAPRVVTNLSPKRALVSPSGRTTGSGLAVGKLTSGAAPGTGTAPLPEGAGAVVSQRKQQALKKATPTFIRSDNSKPQFGSLTSRTPAQREATQAKSRLDSLKSEKSLQEARQSGPSWNTASAKKFRAGNMADMQGRLNKAKRTSDIAAAMATAGRQASAGPQGVKDKGGAEALMKRYGIKGGLTQTSGGGWVRGNAQKPPKAVAGGPKKGSWDNPVAINPGMTVTAKPPSSMDWAGSSFKQRLAYGQKHGKGAAYKKGMNQWWKARRARRNAQS